MARVVRCLDMPEEQRKTFILEIQQVAEKIETAVDASILGSDIRSDLITVSDGPCVACGDRGTSTLVARTY